MSSSNCHVTWVMPDGRRIEADVAEGTSFMLAAQFEGVPDITGDCGGCLSCATCHVVVDPVWTERVGPPGDEERVMLESAPATPRGGSRLSCQIQAQPSLNGLVLHVPAA